MDPDRRRLIAALLSSGALGACTPPRVAAPSPALDHRMDLLLQVEGAVGHAEVIALVLYPGFTLLDVVGPHHMFTGLLGAEVMLVGASLAPVMSDTGIPLSPSMTFRDCPRQLGVVCVPGGTAGTVAAMEDPQVLSFLEAVGRDAQWVTSVCTGSLVLGAAGLLRGYRATSHWVVRDVLEQLGATSVSERVVVDRNRITGGGVTAGIDMALTVAMALRGRAYAEVVQLFAEYAPAPPVDAGTPERAPPRARDALVQMLEGFTSAARAAAVRARHRWG